MSDECKGPCDFRNGECFHCDADCPDCDGLGWTEETAGDPRPCQSCNALNWHVMGLRRNIIIKQAAHIEGLKNYLNDLAVAINWISENHPKALRDMPGKYFATFSKAHVFINTGHTGSNDGVTNDE